MGSFFYALLYVYESSKHILPLATLSRPDDSVRQVQGNTVSVRGDIDQFCVRTSFLCDLHPSTVPCRISLANDTAV